MIAEQHDLHDFRRELLNNIIKYATITVIFTVDDTSDLVETTAN